jgi:hypothetical protein
VPTPLIVQHPIVADKVRQIRDATTSNADFLRLSGEISRFLAYEAFRNIPTTATTVDTPVLKNAPAVQIDQQFVIVPILRAGLGMSPAIQEVLPHHRVCLVGLRRNETTLVPDVYLDGLPEDLEGAPVVLCDPDARNRWFACLRARHACALEAPERSRCFVSSSPRRDSITSLSTIPTYAIVGGGARRETQ